jgi:UDPglucose 6-dehydrogenase
MKLTIIGTGYVGLVTGACFAEMGNTVCCVDVNAKRIDALKRGEMPIFEPGLATMVTHNQAQGRLSFTTDLREAIAKCELCFIAVGTPMSDGGKADLQYVLTAAAGIGQSMLQPVCVVDKSTVPVGTAAKVRRRIQEELDKRGSKLTFEVVSNPEFLKEGSAVGDCLKPDRVVIGADSQKAVDLLQELYKPFVMNTANFIVMDIASAEMTKYAANAMLATKISFINEIANICELVGADVNKVRLGIGSDHRIGYQFIYPGCGYGGSCFPKDVQALICSAGEIGYQAQLLQAVDEVNVRQKRVMLTKLKQRFGENLTGKLFAVWGLAFKPDTDDVRESTAITIIRDLTGCGALITAYDPQAVPAAKHHLQGNERISYAENKYEMLTGAEAMLLITEWKEFRSPDFVEMKARLKQPVIFDGRNQYDVGQMRKRGFEYYPIGVSTASGKEAAE